MKLTVVEGGTQSVYRFESAELYLGRSIENDLRLNSGLVSRRHCRLSVEDGEIWVEDLNSANGTVVGGERIARTRIPDRGEFMVGGTRVRVELDGEEVPRPDAGTGILREGLRTHADGEDSEADRMAAFARIATLLAAEVELKPLLERIVDAAVGMTEAERGFLLLDADAGEARSGEGPRTATDLKVRLARNFDGSDIPIPRERLSGGICDQVLATGRPLVSLDAGRDERFEASVSVEDLRLRSVLCLPIQSAGVVEGVLYVDNRLRSGVFTEEDLDLAEHFAALASVAIKNARLVEELRVKNEHLQVSAEQIKRLNSGLGRKVRDRDVELSIVRKELSAERGRHDYNEIIGSSSAMRKVFEVLDRVVETDLPVRIAGESGTGKELIARAIHKNGARAKRPFVSVNCAAVPDSLLSSELFGHAKGAFTGADRSRRGLFQQADGGSLFLDEVGDMSEDMQSKLLRVLQEREVRPVGSNSAEKVDVRVIVASHRDLHALVEAGTFREDLFYRLNVLTVDLPPLRERGEDIPLLAEALLARAAREAGQEAPILPVEVLTALAAHDWPGNVRELENEMRRVVVLADGMVRLDLLSERVLAKAGGGTRKASQAVDVDGDLRAAVASFEARAIRDALDAAEGNKSRAAESLGISRFALQRKMEKYSIDLEEGDES
ncbi:MAG: sigma 54-interacting transcriptional regulator [Planctomycetota bacterium]|nr:sigma 54-interacting transcriptional regulator [Planctomycetota bacterium]